MTLVKHPMSDQPRGRRRRFHGADAAATATAEGRPLTYSIAPEDTDPTIDNWKDAHLAAFDPEADTRNRLFVFFCGSFGIPARQTLITQLAARMGYHAINLCYPNAWTVGGLCRGSRVPDCHERVRLQVFDGVPRTDLIAFTPANAIANRLVKLLAYLGTTLPDQGWSRYLDATEPDWGSIVVAGHSQGGGQAAIIGKLESVARVIMFAAPVDRGPGQQPHAAWLSRPGATPPSHYFGFVHRDDPGFEAIQTAWSALGMDAGGAPPVPVDDSDPPYGHSQRLITDTAEIRRGRYHGCVIQDGITPGNAGGQPRFAPVWRYLLDA